MSARFYIDRTLVTNSPLWRAISVPQLEKVQADADAAKEGTGLAARENFFRREHARLTKEIQQEMRDKGLEPAAESYDDAEAFGNSIRITQPVRLRGSGEEDSVEAAGLGQVIPR